MSKHCTECGRGTLHDTTLAEHVEDVGGIRVRLLQAVIQWRCAECGEVETIIPDQRGLVEAVAMARALEPVRLGAADLKLMRRALDMNQREFAEQMGVAPETASRWESNAGAIGGEYEKAVRYGVCALLCDRQPLLDYDPTLITRMRIPAVRAIDATDAIMCFYRVHVRARQQRGQVWEPQECVAA